jgi:hypothetical protein
MQEFFQSERRKFGIVVLTMACVLMAAWVRSQFATDSIGYRTVQRGFAFASIDGAIEIFLFGEAGENADALGICGLRWGSGDPESMNPKDHGIDWDWECLGFRRSDMTTWSITVIPDWALILILTVWSGWLILSKEPRVKPVESPQEKP